MRTAISAGNANSAKGSIDGPTRAYTINANDQLLTAKDYENLIVAYRNGAPVRVRDVARAVDRCRKHQARCLGQCERGAEARHHPQRAAPAGRQRDRHRRRHQARLPELQSRACPAPSRSTC
jgi:hypothetical protein